MPSVETMEKILPWANSAYYVLLLGVAILTIVIGLWSKRVTDAKDRELAEYRAEAEVKIAAAEATAAEAEARAAEANASALQAQLELEKLKEPRTIAPEDQATIIAELEAFAGQKYSLSVFPDPEALALLRVLHGMLQEAGWEKTDFSDRRNRVSVEGITVANTLASGVFATIGPDDSASVAAIRALSAGLYRAGLPCRRGYHDAERQKKSPNTISLDIGKKPVSKE